jgi:hypothetical protein
MASGLPPLAKSPRRLRPRSPAPARVLLLLPPWRKPRKSPSAGRTRIELAVAAQFPGRYIYQIYTSSVYLVWPQHGTGKPRALGSRVRPAARPWLHVSAPARRRWTPRHRLTACRDREATSSRPSTVWGSRACTQNCRCSKGSRSRTSPEISPQD